MVNGSVGRYQALVGFLQRRIALHLEGEVVQADAPFLEGLRIGWRFEQSEVVMHDAAGQKGARAIGTKARYLEPHHITIERRGPRHISDIEYEMADFLGYTRHTFLLSCWLAPPLCVFPFQLRGRALKALLLHLQPRLPTPGAS